MIQETESRPAFTTMAAALGVCFVAICALGLGKLTGAIDPLVARRGVGAMLGLILVVTGNFVPKLHLFQPATGTLHSDKIDRFAGWTFVASGLSSIALFLFAPADKIMIAAPFVALLGFLAVFTRWLIWKAPEIDRIAPSLTGGRLALASMLATVFAVCGIFIADTVWGDAVSRPMGILFPFALIIFAHRLRRRLHA